ncbi:LysR family transcriptional regulator [uncultured Roseobacter sp.]|uniref:LysR family transcriptional regulator n=1 Tax=uncultured Roseobacter sp. TaxID=114847 RepID=UPI002628D8E7|nr:LysR family transcriptional regulator [uncultured Roseobacter sp.]
MQSLLWNDLRILLALARAQSLSGAATLLGVNATTVSRRLKMLEDGAGVALLIRERDGTVGLTESGQMLANHADAMERHAIQAEAALGQDTVLSGTVRLTASPFLLNRFVIPGLSDFTTAHPALQVSLVPDNRNLSLTRREVDLAIRFGEPKEGGDAVLTQRLGRVMFSAFTATAFADVPMGDRPWLGYESVARHLPQASWTEMLAKATGGRLSSLLMHDLEAAYETTLHMPVRAVLPDAVARNAPQLERLEDQLAQDMNRDVWLMRHRDTRGMPRMEAMVDWLTQASLFE